MPDSLASGKDLSFEQQQEIDRLAELAYKPSSNSNKYRFALYAHIDALIAIEVQQGVEDAMVSYQAELLKDYEADIRQAVEKALEAKDNAYWERDQLVAALSKIYPAWLGWHSEPDWENDWRNIVYIKIPVRRKVVSGDQHNMIPQKYWFETTHEQVSWHIHDGELKYFEHLKRGDETWDGHTTEEKYERLAALNPKGK